uniref:Uncharacterized protein n=1 Tax=Nelumbo nucifera TaxID=4432 RepID=A0A822YKE8_NELNU|nr:TPA_asm: hypothetical protein HUJ06_010630 [Nelumbo nucifera]
MMKIHLGEEMDQESCLDKHALHKGSWIILVSAMEFSEVTVPLFLFGRGINSASLCITFLYLDKQVMKHDTCNPKLLYAQVNVK